MKNLKICSTTNIFLTAFFLLVVTHGAAIADEHSICSDPDRIRTDIEYLASDELEGRFPGTDGIELAAEYIRDEFIDMGLETINDSDDPYCQPFEASIGISLGNNNVVTVTTPDGAIEGELLLDFVPSVLSGNGVVEGDVIFAGYGITADEYGWDDYADIDAEGKIVFCWRAEPGRDDPDSVFDGDNSTRYTRFDYKASNAQAHGAVALLVATAPGYVDEDSEGYLTRFRSWRGLGSTGIPIVQVSQEIAEAMFSVMGAPMSMYHAEVERHHMAFGSELDGVTASVHVDLNHESAETRNVAGILRGSDPDAGWVVVGAHYDHLGMGIETSRHEGEPAIHNGADDNASGVSGVLELARMASQLDVPPVRSILFICFSAEELGLLGSGYYIDNPLVPLDETSAMINMDMIGRVHPDDDGNDYCSVHAYRTAVEWEEIIPDTTPDGLVEFHLHEDIVGGDYINFFTEEIPTINFFTGIHDDYHRPSDDAELINYEGEASVIGGIYEIMMDVANREGNLTFQEQTEDTATPPDASDGDEQVTLTAYLGTIPDFESTDDGFYIAGTTPGSPAEEAGLLAGDRILAVGEYEVNDIYSYTYALAEFSAGDTTIILVDRNDEEIEITVTFGSRD